VSSGVKVAVITEVPTPTTVAILPFSVITDVSEEENANVPVSNL
jgi:hypothetical protein